MSCVLAAQGQGSASRKSLDCIYDMLTGQASAKEGNYACTSHEVSTTDVPPQSSEDQQSEMVERKTIFTSSYDDWMWRGDDPIVKDMSWYVYSMWVYKVEVPAFPERAPRQPRHVDIEFAQHYHLRNTHIQRLATEYRVPLFEGFTMPSAMHDAEVAAMYKQLLLRPLAVESGAEPDEERLLKAFTRMCTPDDQHKASTASGLQQARAAATCFSRSWQQWADRQKEMAMQGRQRFLSRYEWPSIWETQEVQEKLVDMWTNTRLTSRSDGAAEDDLTYDEAAADGEDPSEGPHDHDAGKPRATIQHYTSIIGQDVAQNLEGLARARLEKHPRAYQTDAEIHEAYTKIVYGGGDGTEDGDADVDPQPEPGKLARSKVFQPMGKIDEAKQSLIINFQTRTRLNATTKELLAMPCMQTQVREEVDLTAPLSNKHVATPSEVQAFREWGLQSHSTKLDVLREQQEGYCF